MEAPTLPEIPTLYVPAKASCGRWKRKELKCLAAQKTEEVDGLHMESQFHGRRLRENWGDGSQKIRGGGRPMHPSPIIWGSAVIGCEAKYKMSLKGIKEKIFLNRGFWRRKGLYIRFQTSRDRQRQKK